jgi:hypothetical protein
MSHGHVGCDSFKDAMLYTYVRRVNKRLLCSLMQDKVIRMLSEYMNSCQSTCKAKWQNPKASLGMEGEQVH